jgi:UDP-N-acetylmuramoyl-L-alanyl-D-glutamate--2,6-diaminopimelate ligase
MGSGAARIGSLGMVRGERVVETGHTSPPSEVAHEFLASLPQNCPGVAIEISSHAAHQFRYAGLPLRALAFTGLGRDHLDYHQTMRAYLGAKLQCMDLLAPNGWLVVNADDAHSTDFIQRAGPACRVVELGLQRGEVLVRPYGSAWRLLYQGAMYDLPLEGAVAPFQAWNAAAGALLAHAAGVPLETALQSLASCPVVPGRMEICAEQPITYVDYACTPQAVQRCVKNLKNLYVDRPLAVVFGCGGDRDEGKRPIMGNAASAADFVFISNDNPRSESPERIVEQILSGRLADHAHCQVILDRSKAIVAARQVVGAAGVVAVLGKGDESFQIIGDAKYAWSDRDFVRSLTAEVSSA